MPTLKNVAQITTTLDSNGDVTLDVTDGLNFEITGVVATVNDAYAVAVRGWQTDADHYKFRVFKLSSGALVAAANQQVTFTYAVYGG